MLRFTIKIKNYIYCIKKALGFKGLSIYIRHVELVSVCEPHRKNFSLIISRGSQSGANNVVNFFYLHLDFNVSS